jgi:predicted nucleic acid-binding protein
VPSSVYIDTNIIVDICDNTRPAFASSQRTVVTLLGEDATLYINSDTLSNLYYILSKQSQYSNEEVLARLTDITEIFTLVTTTQIEVEQAIKLCLETNSAFKDYEDALQYVCAKKVEAGLIVSNDKGFVSPDVVVRGSDDII